MTLGCIPHGNSFAHGYVGLFWASYIHQPESFDIHFQGHGVDEVPDRTRWIRGTTQAHGKLSTHLAKDDQRVFLYDEDFPLSLVFNRSNHRFSDPWYFGVSYEMAFMMIFRPQDQIRISQPPSGGGRGNPVWDFQMFIPGDEPRRCYQMLMRALDAPFQSVQQIEQLIRSHRKALGHNR